MVTGDMLISEVLELNPNTAGVFMGFGMGCVGCMAARGETVEEAAAVHGIDVEELLEKLNLICEK